MNYNTMYKKTLEIIKKVFYEIGYFEIENENDLKNLIKKLSEIQISHSNYITNLICTGFDVINFEKVEFILFQKEGLLKKDEFSVEKVEELKEKMVYKNIILNYIYDTNKLKDLFLLCVLKKFKLK